MYQKLNSIDTSFIGTHVKSVKILSTLSYYNESGFYDSIKHYSPESYSLESKLSIAFPFDIYEEYDRLDFETPYSVLTYLQMLSIML